jgi:hypothetical protein
MLLNMKIVTPRIFMSMGVILKFLIFFIGGFSQLLSPIESDLLNFEFNEENMVFGSLYFMIFMFFLSKKTEYNFTALSVLYSKLTYILFFLGYFLVSFLIKGGITLLLLAVWLAIFSLYSKFKVVAIFLSILLFFYSTYIELEALSYLPLIWIGGVMLVIIFLKYIIRNYLLIICFLMIAVGIVMLLYLGSYGSNGIKVRFVEQIAPAVWGNFNFNLGSYFDLNGVLSGVPEHRRYEIEGGSWAPQFQLSYLFRYEAVGFLIIYALICKLYFFLVDYTIWSINNKMPVETISCIYILIYMSSVLLTEKFQEPTVLTVFFIVLMLFRFMIESSFNLYRKYL